MGFLVVVVLTAILGGVSIVSFKNIIKAKKHHTSPVQSAIRQIRSDIDRIVRTTGEYYAGWMTKKKASEKIEEKKENIEKELAVVAGLFTPEELNEFKTSIDELYKLSAELFLLHGKSREERTRAIEKFDEKVEEIQKKIDIMVGKVDELSKVSMRLFLTPTVIFGATGALTKISPRASAPRRRSS